MIQLDMFDLRRTPEFIAWLGSPPGTMAPWVLRERIKPVKRPAARRT